jgi:signal transduction histidine kinase
MIKHKQNLAEQVSALSELHQVITKNYHNEQELFREYLGVGTKIFNLETGIVSRIEGDAYTILAFTSPLEGLSAGLQFPLQDTYCREVYEANKSVAFPRVGQNEKMCNHPVYVNMKLESYISAPIFVNGKLSGTINFTDRRFRDSDFSPFEFQVIEIMANTVGRFLEAQQIKNDLEASNRKLNELIGVVSHDLRNPIGSILGCAELLQEYSQGNNEALDIVALIEESSNYALEMLESILEISAIRGGKISLRQKPTDIKEVIENAWRTISFRATKKNVSHKLQCDENLPRLNIDKQRFKQVFENLYTNAIKFSHSGSIIETHVSHSANETLIVVKDYGVGMNEKQLQQIFDNAQTDSTIGTDGEKGTGYGLPLIEQIVKLHEGNLDVSSQENQGTEIRIRL